MSAKLLQEAGSKYGTLEEEEDLEHGRVLYRASFEEMEDTYVRYRTWALFFIGLAMIFAYGLGFLILLWIPVLRYIARQDLRSRRLYITSENVVYKNAPPACCPCFGVNRTEKHILLPLITDVVLSQSWFEAWFGIWTVTIENAGQGGGGGGNNHAATPDLKIQGIYQPELFKKLLLRAATAKRAGLQFTVDDVEGILSNQYTAPPSIHTAAAYPPAPMGYPPHFGSSAALQSSEQAQAMNDTLVRMERLLERQTQLLSAVLSQQNNQAPTYPFSSTTTTTTTSSQSILPL